MSTTNKQEFGTFFSSLLGASVALSASAVMATILFNGLARFLAGPNLTFEQAYSAVPTFSYYWIIALSSAAISNALGGFVAAKLSPNSAYMCALISGVLILIWSSIMYLSPLKVVQIDLHMLIQSFVVPIPLALAGAFILVKVRNENI